MNNKNIKRTMNPSQQQAYRFRKRIKTQAPTSTTSPVIMPSTPNRSTWKQTNRLPSLYEERKHKDEYSGLKTKQSKLQKYIHRLSMIDEESISSNKTYWQQISRKRNTISLSPRKRKQIQKAEKLYGLLCQQKPQSGTTENPQTSVKSSNARIHQRHSQIYQKAETTYEQMRKKKKTKDVQEIFNFINILKTFNNLFVKLDDMLALILLKKGRVYEFQQNFTVYSQNQLQNCLLIILWGQIKLKEIYSNKSRYSIPGDMLCEEVLIDDKGKKKYFSEIGFSKGSLISLQTAKTLTSCGVLEITKQTYQQIKTRFIENGQKDKILVFQHMLSWSLSKKAPLRK